MSSSVGRAGGASLERSCQRDEWVEARELGDGVELFRARLWDRPYGRHRHDLYAVGVTEEGRQAFDYRGTVERSRPGLVYVLHPDEVHDGRAEGDGVFGYRQVYIDPAHIAAALATLTGRAAPPPFAPPVINDGELVATIDAAFQAAPEPLAVDALTVGLTRGLLRWSGGRGELPARVDRRSVERGRELLSSRPAVVRSSDVEAVTGLDRYQFAHQFRALYGTSPYRYSMMRRLDLARARLREGTALADAALDAGFADQAHLTRLFKAAFGMTPGRYARLSAAPTSGSRSRRDCPPGGRG